MTYTPDDLSRRGWNAETQRHRNNLARALDGVQRTASSLERRLQAGETELSGETRQLVADAVDAAQSAAALEAANQLDFLLPEEPR